MLFLLSIPNPLSHDKRFSPANFHTVLGGNQTKNLLAEIVTPDLLGNLDLEADLGPLLLLAELVALHGAGEAALVAEAELVEAAGAELGGLVEAADDVGLVVEGGLLGGHDAEDDDLVVGQVAQGGEVARAGVVVLEEVDVDVELLEEDLGDGLVAALGEPLRAVVAAAQVDANGHVLGALLDGLVDQGGVLAGQDVGVAMALLSLGAHARVAQVGQVGVVELDHADAGGVQVGELLLVDAGEVVEEGLEGRVGLLGNGLTRVAEVDHGGRGDGDLGGDLAAGTGGGDLRLEVVEVVDLNGLGVRDLVHDHEARGHGAALGDIGRLEGAALLDTGEVDQVVNVEPLASELAVRHGAEPGVDLLAHNIGNVLVLQLLQVVLRELAAGHLFTGRQDIPRPQQGADLVGTVDTNGQRHDVGVKEKSLVQGCILYCYRVI